MGQDKDSREKNNELRRRAEETLRTQERGQGRPPAPGELSEEALLHLVHELQVHQMELEMQNEALQQAQSELAEARDRFFDLYDLAPVGYFLVDEEGGIRSANLAGAALFGIHRSELQGKTLTSFVYPQDQDDFFTLSRQAYQQDGQVEGDLRLVKGDRSLFYAHLRLARVKEPDAEAGHLRLILQDITERVVLGQQLARNVAILAGAERIAHLGGWEWDIEADVVTLSDELQRIYGCQKSRYSLADFLLLAHPADRPAKREALERALAGSGKFQLEFRIIRHNDQAERYLLASGEVIFHRSAEMETGSPVKVYGAIQDVTELKLNERRLKAYAASLEVMNRDLESFTYVASHDLQEPLRKIIKFGELVKTHIYPQVDNEIKEYIDRMQSAASRMQALIMDLLTFSRVAYNQISYQPVDLNQTLSEVLDDLGGRIEKSKGRVEVSQLPTVSAEPILMQQLFQNLIGNALKFHAPEKPPVVKVEATQLIPDLVEIRVIDQGIGFDEREIEKIFRPFERLHNRGEYEGSGVGLAICRRIVERHSGSINARSQPGDGSTFIVTLPLQQA